MLHLQADQTCDILRQENMVVLLFSDLQVLIAIVYSTGSRTPPFADSEQIRVPNAVVNTPTLFWKQMYNEQLSKKLVRLIPARTGKETFCFSAEFSKVKHHHSSMPSYASLLAALPCARECVHSTPVAISVDSLLTQSRHFI